MKKRTLLITLLLLSITAHAVIAENLGEPVLQFDSSGDDEYKLRFTTASGLNYAFDFIDNGGQEGYRIGDEDDDLVWIEGDGQEDYLIEQNDAFIVSDAETTHVLKYQSYTDEELTFTELSGKIIEVQTSGNKGLLELDGTTYHINVGPAPHYKLSIDLNADGTIGGTCGTSPCRSFVLLKDATLDLGICDQKQLERNSCDTTNDAVFRTIFTSGRNEIHIGFYDLVEDTVGLAIEARSTPLRKVELQNNVNTYYIGEDIALELENTVDDIAQTLTIYTGYTGELEESTPDTASTTTEKDPEVVDNPEPVDNGREDTNDKETDNGREDSKETEEPKPSKDLEDSDDVEGLKAEVGALKEEIKELKGEVGEVKEEAQETRGLVDRILAWIASWFN